MSSTDRKVMYTETENLCDDSLTNGAWYRFDGDAGTRMSTTCVAGIKCVTTFPGWLKASHTTVLEGVIEGYVCFQKFEDCEAECPFKIKVKNCTSYNLYNLYRPPGCLWRYCVTDST